MIYLARRNPTTTHAEFLDNWKAHSQLAARYPHVSHPFIEVAQARVLIDSSWLPEASREYDGLNILTVTSLLDVLESRNHPDAQGVLLEDELRVFASDVSRSSVVAHEYVLIPGPRTHYVLAQLIQRAPGTSENDFVRYWSGDYARSLMALPVFKNNVVRFVHNHVVLDRPKDCNFDGVAEYWFRDEQAIKECVTDGAFRELITSRAKGFCVENATKLLVAKVNHARPPIAESCN